ncbi:unnamed protein product [Danaus chrysippus]|uniref:(African queen) hypothetical protein n=1 Tax=Danaus chrysippus TaxID=151541 RepID=A0A8J2VVD5_9NEOP|nr:unnamed protein product [Danaus chrysippus]
MMIMDVGMYNNTHTYSGDCYQQPAYSYDGYEGYYEPATYYDQLGHAPGHDAPPVISTDTGLCYTNLDYGEQAANYHLATVPPATHDEHKIDNHYIDTKYNMQYMDETQYTHGSPLACGEYDAYHKDFPELREGFPREEVQHVQPHATHATVPTYKWMQVKRNIPKPAGE